MQKLKAAACILASAILSGCGPSVGEVKKEDVSSLVAPDLVAHATGLHVDDLKEGESVETYKQKLIAAGLVVQDTRPELTALRVVGLHGKTVNEVFAPLPFLSSFTAKTKGGFPSAEYSVEMYGANWKRMDRNVKFSQDLSEGRTWPEIAKHLGDEFKRADYKGFPEKLRGGQESFQISVAPDGLPTADQDAMVSVDIQSCVPPGYSNRGFTNTARYASDDLYWGSVCELRTSIYRKGQDKLYSKIYKDLKVRYVAQFGEPDCWENDCKDDRSKLVKAAQEELRNKEKELGDI